MNSPRTRARHPLTGLATAGCLIIIMGCGDDSGLGQRYPVYGKVTYQDAPVEKGSISFIPEATDGHAATGTIQDGSYSMTTLTPGDGVFPGKYKVIVIAREEPSLDTLKAETDAKVRALGLPPGERAMPPELVSRAHKTAQTFVPEKYGNPATSDLKVEVKAESNSLDLKLEGDLKPIEDGKASSSSKRSRGRTGKKG